MKIPFKSGFEQDALTGWRKVLKYMKRPGVAKKAKRQYSHRVRTLSRQEIEDQLDECN